MILVVEGPDGVGKTSLAKELAGRLNAPYWNRPQNPFNGLDVNVSQAMHETEMDMLAVIDQDIVIDRFFPSEWAYNKAFGREFDRGAIEKLARRFMTITDAMMIHVYWPVDVTDDDIDQRTDDEVSVHDIRRVQLEYSRFFRKQMMPLLELNCIRPLNMQIESVMREVVRRRPTKDALYMAIAKQAARRSTCLSRRTGAVIVSESGHVIATGMNGAPAGVPHQCQCERLRSASYGSGGDWESCVDVHAEENAILQAAAQGAALRGSTMYTLHSPCGHCAKLIINAGITEVVYERRYGDESGLRMIDSSRLSIKHREMRR